MRARRCWWPWAAFACAALPLFVYTARFHEFWRDEVQTALIARAVAFVDLLSAMRREAVPPVVFVVLKAADVLPPPYSLSALGALGFASLLFGTYRLLLTISKSPTMSAGATAAFALTDTYCYELGVVVRQYGLGLGFALACVGYLGRAIVSDDGRDARRGAAFGALAVSTSVHPGCLAGAALLAYSIERLVRKRNARAIVEPLCALPAFLFTFFLLTPYDRAPEGLLVFHRTFADALAIAWGCLLDGVLCRGWWTPQNIDPYKHAIIALVGIGMVALVSTHLRTMQRRPSLAAFYAATLGLNALTLSYIFVIRYQGAYRHHLFVFMPAMVMAVGLLLSKARSSVGSWALRWSPGALFLPWLLFQYWACASDLVGDFWGAFSGTKAAAAALPPGARVVVAGKDYVALGILYWRPDISMRAQSSMGRPFRYLLEDWEWHREVPLRPLLVEECRRASDVYVVVPDEAPFADTRCADEVLTPSSMIPSEHFSVFDLRCTCQAGLAQEAARSE